jgi:hypothetical protein
MISSIEVRNALGTLVGTLPVGATSSESPYVIKDIGGLGPVKAEITTSPYATQDGGYFQSARTGERNIVIKMGYKPDYATGKTVETLRRELYSIFSPKGLSKLRFFNNDAAFKTTEIIGYTEAIEPEFFSKEPLVSVSLICPKPYFNELAVVAKVGSSGTSIESPYDGDAPVGFTLWATFMDATNRLILKNGVDQNLELRFQVPPPGGGLADPFSPTMFDQITWSTIPGDKYIRLNRSGTIYNLLPYVKSGGLSMKLTPEVQTVTLDVGTSGTPGSDLPGDWEWPVVSGLILTCTPAYVGL